jgi:hypothetical protein
MGIGNALPKTKQYNTITLAAIVDRQKIYPKTKTKICRTKIKQINLT